MLNAQNAHLFLMLIVQNVQRYQVIKLGGSCNKNPCIKLLTMNSFKYQKQELEDNQENYISEQISCLYHQNFDPVNYLITSFICLNFLFSMWPGAVVLDYSPIILQLSTIL